MVPTELAGDVEVDERPGVVDTHGVERLHVSVNAPVLAMMVVQMVEGEGEVVCNLADGKEVATGDVVVRKCRAERAIGEMEYE